MCPAAKFAARDYRDNAMYLVDGDQGKAHIKKCERSSMKTLE